MEYIFSSLANQIADIFTANDNVIITVHCPSAHQHKRNGGQYQRRSKVRFKQTMIIIQIF